MKTKSQEEKKLLCVLFKVISKLQNPNIICDRKGTILFANDSYKTQTDKYYDRRRFWTMFPTSKAAPVYFKDAVAQGIETRSEISTRDKTFIIRVIPISDILIDEILYMITFENITLSVNLNLQLKQDKLLLQKSFMDSILAFSSFVDSRDPYTFGHQQRVAALAMNIASRAKITDLKLLSAIYYGALMHDIGKIAIPMEYLVTPRRLSEHEFEIIKTHVGVGNKIIEHMEFPWDIKSVVYQHHERLDGSGYPNGLKGKEITIPARIVAIADVYEAMTTDRPYRKSIDEPVVFEYLTANKGTLFDGEFVDCFFQCASELKNVYETNVKFRPFDFINMEE